MDNDTILFYAVSNQYGEFSNFAHYPIKLKGKVWQTSEHYFQAHKFEGTAYKDKIRKAPNPMKAAEMGRTRKVKIRPNWDSIKDNVMYEAVKAKFLQYPELQKLLLDTKEATIIEHTENDDYWGDGGNGKGKNKLGKILMKVREELR